MEENKNLFKKKPRKTIKTYRDFAMKALKDKPTSLAQMIIKEKQKKEFEYNNSSKSKKNIFYIIISVILVLLGIISVASIILFSYYKKEEISKQKVEIKPQSIIYFDYKSQENIKDLDRRDLISLSQKNLEDTNIPIGDIKIFYFVKTGEDGNNFLIDARNFMEALDTKVSLQFLRNLNSEFSFGVISDISGMFPFLVLSVKNFDSSYESLIAWEKSLLNDLGPFLNLDSKYNRQKFQDLNLYNKDAKVVLNENGKIVFGYSFLDLKKVVFFTNEKSFKKIITSFLNNKEKK